MSSSFHWLSDGSDLVSNGMNAPPKASLGDSKRFFHRERSYANSKLAQIIHARALSRKFKEEGSNISMVSVCPGWVGTNVAGTTGLNMILQTIAYPSDGFGLASTLEAMFLPNTGTNATMDYFVNSVGFDYLGFAVMNSGLVGKSWPVQTGIRDLIAWVSAIVLLFTQKLGSDPHHSFSSPESYNSTAQDNLYQWSKKAVSDWL